MSTPVQRHVLGGVSRGDIAARSVTAWTALSGGSQAITVIGVLGAIVSISSSRVPIASGVAVSVLIVAAIIDVRERRLPDALVGTAALLFAVVLGLEAALSTTHDVASLAGQLRNAALGAGVFAAPLLTLHLIAPSSMGFGDVKAGLVFGAATGVVDWQLALVALTLAAGLAATVGIARRARSIAFGPGLVAGAVIALLFHPLLLPSHASAGDPHLAHRPLDVRRLDTEAWT